MPGGYFTAILAVVLVPLLLGLVWKGERIPKSAFEDQDEDQTRSWQRNEVFAGSAILADVARCHRTGLDLYRRILSPGFHCRYQGMGFC